jgi:hypothetical protein
MHTQREHDVARNAQVRKEAQILKDNPHGPPMRRQGRDVFAVEKQAAARRFHETRNHQQQGGFARPARPEHRKEFPRQDFDGKPADDRRFAVNFAEVLDLEPTRRGSPGSAALPGKARPAPDFRTFSRARIFHTLPRNLRKSRPLCSRDPPRRFVTRPLAENS